jgi:hypothetical protein
MKEEIIESAVPRKYIIEYFESTGGIWNNNGKFKGIDWEVEISDEFYRVWGSVKLNATIITFRASEKRCQEIVDAFRLNFLSAGG